MSALDAALTLAQAVVVLLAPDEPGDDSRPGSSSARPNLLFELGLAMGRAPDKTVIVQVGEVQGVTDLAGFDLVRLSGSAASRRALANRLRSAGCPVDTTGKQWLTAGNFAAPEPSPAWRLLDSTNFDLVQIRGLIREAMSAASGPVIGFGMTYQGPVFAQKLSALLRAYQEGDAEVKDSLLLSPLVTTSDLVLGRIRRYQRELDTVNVLCEIIVDAALPDDTLAEFWTRVRREFAGANRNRLVLIFSFHGVRSSYPGGIVMLPSPAFQFADVARWAEDLVRQRGWSMELASAWTTWLCARAAVDDTPGSLDPDWLYQAMDDSIDSFRMSLSPDEFLSRLRTLRLPHFPAG
jgi:hypothetical protein